MKDRFFINEEGRICDSSSNGLVLSVEEIVELMNKLQKISLDSLNEVSRLEEGLIDLDIKIGTLSWYVSDDSEYTMKDIEVLSVSLSRCITGVMYPKVEDKDGVSGFR